ncbi:short-chain collagen C4-like [Patiria miniata]|uniref:Short-chain collagen C4-like n=1 Tax=Patiria miniata TaxID=46514 RepID=A0A914BCA9_PATMI|nr:short-chain collagen C4-like [Patiria miniata]
MAPNHKLSEVSVDGGYLIRKKYPAKNGRFWLQFLVGTLLNVCIIAASVGLTMIYVNTELQSLKDQMQIHEERLAWLEGASSKQEAGEKDVPTWKDAQLRTRRDRQPQVSSGHSVQRNETHLPGYGPGNAGAALCRDGRDGRDGKDGQDGAQGPAGPAGPTGMKGQKGDPGIDTDRGSSDMMLHRRAKRDLGDGNSSLTAENQESGAHDVKPSGGETYVRWGRTTCPSDANTELVYAGIAAGAHYTNKGGSVDFFCLPSDPEWSASHKDGVNSGSFLYGMEYEVSAFDPFSHENAEFLHDRDVPCAVCRLMDRGTQHLFPAKLGCPEDWTEEYRGFLMSGNQGHEQRSKAVCVDEAPEATPGSQTSENGALLYIIEGKCGSLLCPPYVEGREIACTVCSI